MRSIALIPARGGSKSVKDKNLREISGMTLVEITIKQAKTSALISEIFISSDSEDILKIAKNANCVAIKRSVLASSDSATANDVVREFLNQSIIRLSKEDKIVYLQPTSPFREEGSIDKALKLYDQKKKPVVGVAQVTQHPQKMLTINGSGTLEGYQQKPNPTANRQTLSNIYIATGSIYIFTVADFLANLQIPITGAIPYIVSGLDTIDIDSEIHLRIAQEIGKQCEF